MNKLKGKLKIAINHLKAGDLAFFYKNIFKRLLSKEYSFGLKRDLNIPFEKPIAKIELSVRLFQDNDAKYFSEEYISGINLREIPYCYVAVSQDDVPFHRQWLIMAAENNIIQTFYSGRMPLLQDDEALIEGVVTIPSKRGLGIMPAVLSQIAEKAKYNGVRYLIAFVLINNVISLKGFNRCGFHPFILRIEKWFLFKRKVTYTEVPDHLMQQYLKDVADRPK